MGKKETGETTTGKIKKAPGFFKKNLSEKEFRKKYLKYIEQPGDREFIRSCYEADGELLKIRRDLGAAEVKRLAALKKAIKQNRKFAVNLLPLGICAALAAALVFFFTVMANPLLRKALETGLEAVFEARVDAENFKLSLLKFEIGMSGLTVADRDAPMKNLIQLGAARIKLKPEAVLRGKVYIEEIRADTMRFGTDRTVSGALPGKPPKEKKPREEAAIPPLVDLKNFNPAELLNREYEKLQTPKLYDSAILAFDTAAAKWKGEEEAVKARVAELRTRAEPFLKINVNDYRTLDAKTIEQLRTLITEINAMAESVKAAQDDVNRMVTEVGVDMETALALERDARNAVTSDFNRLRSYLDPGSGAVFEVLEPAVRSILTGQAETYLAYGARALEVLEKVKAFQAELPKSAPKPAETEKFRGRDVEFPSRQYPKFFMGILAADVLTPSGWHWAFDLRGVSSDPDASGIPASLALALAESGDGLRRSGAFRGQADFRSDAKERFSAELSGGGFPVALSAGLDRLGIGGFSGGASFTLNASGSADGGFSAGGDISIARAALTNPANTFAQAADEAIRQTGTVDLGIAYRHLISETDDFSLNTNFAEILKNALERIVSQYIEKAEEELEKALNARIGQYIDGRFIGKEDLDLIFRAIRGDKSAADELKGTLERKKNELETKVRAAAETAVNQAVDEAKQQGQEAIQDMLQGKTPSAPSLPGFSNPFRR